MISRRHFLATLGSSAAAWATGQSAFSANRPAAPPAHPNIVFILADDLGYGDLSCYGQQKYRTPNIDRLAAEGMRFTQFYAGSTVCAPSRCSLLTGYHTGHAYVRGNAYEGKGIPLRRRDRTIAEILKRAGYATGAIGKWGLGVERTSGQPNRQGFDEWFGYLDQAHAHFHYTDHLWKNRDKVPIRPDQYTHDLFISSALDFIQRHPAHPFFLYLAFTIPHASMEVPEESLRKFQGRFPEKPFDGPHYRPQASPNAAFAGMMDRLDDSVGKILSLLKEMGLDDRTVTFFSSDNGPHQEGGRDPEFFCSSGPLRGIKRDLYEGGIRVPLLARWPGHIQPGAVADLPMAFWDVLPTAAELAGLNPPKAIDGLSMVPLLMGRVQQGHEFLYWEFFERGFQQAVRMGDWKALRLGLKQPLELYDLRNDVGEQNDLANQQPEVIAKFEAFLKTARTESKFWPVKGDS